MDDAKRDLIKAWLTKALHDLAAARTVTASAEPLFDVGAFHCQQAAEKAVKAYLVFRDRPFPKTHDVAELIDRAGGYDDPLRACDDYELYLRMSLHCRFDPLGRPTGLRQTDRQTPD